MRFQITERIATNATITDVGSAMLANFRRIASSAVPVNGVLRVTGIQASFGSINRTDVTDISIQPADDGYLLVADVKYRPSVMFWVILIVTLFTWVFWLIPIVFYLLQKDTVKRGIEEGFRNVKNELMSSRVPVVATATPVSAIADLERLGALLQQGLISKEEFDSQKQKLIGTNASGVHRDSSRPPPRPAPSQEQQASNVGGEEEAQRSFDQARKCVNDGQKDLAVGILKDIVKRFPNTKAAERARKSLAPRNKA